jgi:F-type H+-transporting ATPase subunit epsilon
MPDALVLRVLTPHREICDEPALEATAQGALGEFGVLPDHIGFLTLLEPGLLRMRRPDGGELALAIKGGYAEVRDNVVTVLADDAQPVERIDAEEARADRERAAAALEAAEFGSPERERASRELRWAEVRIELARL